MIALDLRVEIPGRPVTTTTVRQVISRLQVGDYRPGMVLAVVADRTDPRKIVVDWDHSPVAGATDDAATGDPVASMDLAGLLRAAADQVAAGSAGAGSQAMPPAELAAVLRRASEAAAKAATAAQSGSGYTAHVGVPAAHEPTAPESSMPSMPVMPLISSPAAPPQPTTPEPTPNPNDRADRPPPR